MKKIITIIVVVIAIIGIAFLVMKNVNTYNEVEKITEKQQIKKVGATIFPIYDITRVIAGDEFEVVLLLPPGVSPHTFSPQPSVLKNIMGSQALFAIGSGLDDWSHNLVEALNIPVVTVDENIDLLPTIKKKHNKHKDEHSHDHQHANKKHNHHKHDHGPVDPHYWLSITNAKKITTNIANKLAKLDPDNKSIYFERAQNYKNELNQLKTELLEKIKPIKNRNILTSHGAWQYFANDFNLNIVGSFTPAAGTNPSPKDLKKLSRKVKKSDVAVIFIAPQFSGDAIKAFAQDHNLGIARLDPLGGIDERQSYIDLMRFNLEQVVKSFKKIN